MIRNRLTIDTLGNTLGNSLRNTLGIALGLFLAGCSGTTRTETKADAGPPPPPPPPTLAEVMQSVRSHESARDEWTAALCSEVVPKLDTAVKMASSPSRDDLFKYGWILETCGQKDPAYDAYGRALETAGGTWCAASVQRANLEFRERHESDKAVATLGSAIEKEPGCVEANVNRAMYLRLGGVAADLAKARVYLGGFLLAHPDEPAALTELIENQIVPGSSAGSIETAWSLAVRVRQIATTTAASAPERTATLLTTMGRVALRRNDARAAAALFRRAIEINADAIEAHVALGNTMLHMVDPHSALDAFNHALEKKADHYDALIGRAVAYRMLADNEILAASRQSPVPASAGDENADKARSDDEKAIELAGERADAHYNLALLYERTTHPFAPDRSDDLKKAIEHYQHFVEHAGFDPRYATMVHHAQSIINRGADGAHGTTAATPAATEPTPPSGTPNQ